ncbi:MAG: hypothetical protein Q4C03_08005, partial [bacterium]|nr:hypothetical protein [bacterium]
FNVDERNWDAGFKPHMTTENQKSLYASKVVGHADRPAQTNGIGNAITVDIGSVKTPEQAYMFSMTLTNDSDKEKFLKDYAKKNKLKEDQFVSQAEDYLHNKFNR